MRRISAICLLLATTSVAAGDDGEFVVQSRPVELVPRDIGAGWREWQGFDLERNERITALYVTPTDADPVVRGVWVGTSHGWLYRGHDARWTIEAWAQNVEVTGIAFRTDDSDGPVHTILLSTKEDPYFVRFSPDDIGCQFTRVTDAERGLDDSLWFTVTDYGRRSYVARFHHDTSTVAGIPPELGKSRQRGDEVRLDPPVPFSIAEVSPGRLLIGAENAGNLQLDWESRSFERVSDFEDRLREIEVADDGAVWATTSTHVYERPVHRE